MAGFYLSHEAPSSASVALAMHHLVMPKAPWLAARGIEFDWPTAGLPDTVHVDNAREFRSRALARGAAEYGIALIHRPVATPHTGMGKTKIIRKFLRDHPACFDQGTGVTTMPVAAMQMPAEPVERDIYSELLAALGASGPIDGTTHRQKEVCRRLLRTMGVRMLIIDEIHAMLAGSFANGQTA